MVAQAEHEKGHKGQSHNSLMAVFFFLLSNT